MFEHPDPSDLTGDTVWWIVPLEFGDVTWGLERTTADVSAVDWSETCIVGFALKQRPSGKYGGVKYTRRNTQQ